MYPVMIISLQVYGHRFSHFLAAVEQAVVSAGMQMSLKGTDNTSVLGVILWSSFAGLFSDFILVCCGSATLFS